MQTAADAHHFQVRSASGLQMSPRCFPDVFRVSHRCLLGLPGVSQTSPRCLPDIPQMSPRCLPRDLRQGISAEGSQPRDLSQRISANRPQPRCLSHVISGTKLHKEIQFNANRIGVDGLPAHAVLNDLENRFVFSAGEARKRETLRKRELPIRILRF